MMIEKIKITNEAQWHTLRGQDVTASVVGALFDCHEFETRFGLWARKTGRLTADPAETQAMRRGRHMEVVGVNILREEHPKMKIIHNAADGHYFRDPEARIGATPDTIVRCPKRGPGTIQIKSVEASVFRRKWVDEEGIIEPPLWIALQAAVEAYLTGARWAAVAPVVCSHEVFVPLVEVELVDGVIDAVKSRAAEFWQMIKDGREPEPEYTRDGDVLDRMYPHGDDEIEIDLTSDNRIPQLLAERQGFLDQSRECKAALDAIAAEVKAKMGDATVAHIGEGRRITWRKERREGHFVPGGIVRPLRFPKGD